MALDNSGNRIDSDGVKLYCARMAKNVADRAMQVTFHGPPTSRPLLHSLTHSLPHAQPDFGRLWLRGRVPGGALVARRQAARDWWRHQRCAPEEHDP